MYIMQIKIIDDNSQLVESWNVSFSYYTSSIFMSSYFAFICIFNSSLLSIFDIGLNERHLNEHSAVFSPFPVANISMTQHVLSVMI